MISLIFNFGDCRNPLDSPCNLITIGYISAFYIINLNFAYEKHIKKT